MSINTPQQQRNVEAIMEKTRAMLAKTKKAATPADAILIANREAQVENYIKSKAPPGFYE